MFFPPFAAMGVRPRKLAPWTARIHTCRNSSHLVVHSRLDATEIGDSGVKQRPRVGRYLIYGLLDPRDRTLRYVGKTHLRRQIRLERHVQKALEGGRAPVSKWIRELTEQGLLPHIFVLRRVAPDQDWRQGESELIARWRSWSPDELPVTIPPQTPKSSPTEIRGIRLLNVQDGG